MVRDHKNAIFTWGIGGKNYTLHENGLLRLSQPKRKLRLPLGQGMLGLGLDFVKGIRDDLIIGYGTSDGESGTSFACRVRGDLSAVRWCKNIGMFNQRFSVSDDSVWVGALGLAARLNINSGKYVWIHRDLYKREDETDAFVTTCPVFEDEATVTFYGQDTNNRNNKKLKVDRESGSIIEITRIAEKDPCFSRSH
jgi:hypothetical protein